MGQQGGASTELFPDLKTPQTLFFLYVLNFRNGYISECMMRNRGMMDSSPTWSKKEREGEIGE